ncbi:hypothetical protein GCM10010449_21550 [Streptomyces rectiviolaceus]|uniref:Uncharacterized protein n=1 Tax=Streptomyces rectiviolaceus TaxID=332591 RepID=A0ABP6ME30_9ACTN
MEGVRPSSRTAPSIWYADVAAPQRKSVGKVRDSGMEALPWKGEEDEEGRRAGVIARAEVASARPWRERDTAGGEGLSP